MLELIFRACTILAAPVLLVGVGIYAGGAHPASGWAGYGARAMLWGGALALAAAVTSVGYSLVGAMMARNSRDALLRLFGFGRRLVPITMALAAAGVGVGALGGIGWLVTQFDISARNKMYLAFAALALCGAVFVGMRALFETFRAFRLEPTPHLGREAREGDAPELWTLTRTLAEHVGAPAPDAIVVGLLGGPFVTACEMRLEPEGRVIAGRILYLPLPTLLILDIAQLSAVLCHELAHFSGEDAEYSMQLSPYYSAMSRSIQTVAAHESDHEATLVVTYPALSQLVLFTALFDLAVRRWSRERELRADRIAGEAIGADFAASALTRYAAFMPIVDDAIERAMESPVMQPDVIAYVAAMIARAGAQDPRPHLEEETPHPIDTHPTITARVAALGQRLDDVFLREAGQAAPADFRDLGALFFTDADALARQLTTDLQNMKKLRRALLDGAAEDEWLEAA